ncbi:MAG TPA: hypothetical protein VFF06_12865, partial [Polyangia bacterium]|nr:hypothetical protein [Polyangia bacterium]
MAKSFRDTWTVTRGPDGDRGGPELVVLVPPTQSNAAGFSRCRSLIERGDDARPVRLIAEGATIERYWPSWVARAPRCFRMTELDAYLPRDKGPPIVEVTSQLETWLDRVLDGVAPGVRSSAVFWSSALDRHLDQTCQAWLLACGLDDAHRGDELTCTQPSWDCFRFLQARRGMAVTPVEQPRARLAATVLAMQAATLGKRALEYVRERPARRELLRRRAQHAGSPTPRVWITVLGDWPRASRPVLDKIAPLVRESGERLGVLLQTWLHPGLRNSHNQPADPKQMLPTLDAPELDGIIGAIDQGVTAESAAALARAMIESTALSLRVLARVLRSPLTLKLGARTIPIRLADAQLAKLLTLDVLRAREAHHAAQAFARRRSFDGDGDGGGASGRAGEPVVILPHASAVNDRVLVQRFEQRGAATVELVHGVTELSYQLGSGRTHTRVKAMWSV